MHCVMVVSWELNPSVINILSLSEPKQTLF